MSALTTSPAADFLLLAIVGLIVGHTIKLLAQQRWLAFDPLNAFWAGVMVCYVAQPFSYARLIQPWHSEGTIELALFWILFSMAAVILGYEARLGATWAAYIPALPRRLQPQKLAAVGLGAVLLGVVGYAYLMASAGGAAQWLSVGRGATDWINVNAYMALTPVFLPVGVVLLLFHVYFHKAPATRRSLVWALAGLVWLWLFYLGTRSRTIEMTMLMLVGYYLPKQRNPSLLTLGAVFIALGLLTSFQTRNREHFTNLSFNLDQIEEDQTSGGLLPAWVRRGDDDHPAEAERGLEFNCVATVIDLVPREVGYNYGYGLLEFITRPVPRALWQEKPYPGLEAVYPIMEKGELSKTYVATSKKPLLMGPALTFVGYWYAVGGPLALVIAGFLTGCLLRMIRTVHDGAPSSEGHAIIFTFLIMIGFLEAATTPLAWAFSLPFVIVPLFLFLRYARVRPSLPSAEVPPDTAATLSRNGS